MWDHDLIRYLEELGFTLHPDFGYDGLLAQFGEVRMHAIWSLFGLEIYARVRNPGDGCLMKLARGLTREQVQRAVLHLYRQAAPRGRLPEEFAEATFAEFMHRTLNWTAVFARVDHNVFRAALSYLWEGYQVHAPGELRFRFDYGQLEMRQLDRRVLVPGTGSWIGEVGLEGWYLEELRAHHYRRSGVSIGYDGQEHRLAVGSRHYPARWVDDQPYIEHRIAQT